MCVRLILGTHDGTPGEPSAAETASGSVKWRREADEDASRFISRVHEWPYADEPIIASPGRLNHDPPPPRPCRSYERHSRWSATSYNAKFSGLCRGASFSPSRHGR
jgi:hypothetical protein